jgi:hypothetical protein
MSSRGLQLSVASTLLAGCVGWVGTTSGPAPAPVPDAGIVVPPAVIPPQAELTLGDREYIDSVLKEIFTPTGQEHDLDAILKAEIRASIGVFGGTCNVYSSAGLSDCSAQDKSQLSTVDVGAAARQPSSAAREARRIRACEQIVDLPSAMQAAVAKIPSASLDTPPSAPQIAAAFDLFYPGQNLPSDTQDALAALVEGELATPGASWQLLMLTLCQSPGWQIP